jgi:hypothetical protein
MNFYLNYSNYKIIYDYNIDFDYINWIFQLIKPFLLFLLILFLLPITLVLLTYALSFIIFILKHKNKLKVSK